MDALGFPPEFCHRIAKCITTVSYNVLINGASTRYIQPQRGLRQGDPMSLFLFLMCAEGFSALLLRREERGSLHGILVVQDAVPLSHLFFADDAVIVWKRFRRLWRFCSVMQKHLDRFLIGRKAPCILG